MLRKSHKHRSHSHNRSNRHHKKPKNTSMTPYNTGHGDMMSGDSSTLHHPSEELKIDVNLYNTSHSSLFEKPNKHICNEDGAAILVDMKTSNDLSKPTENAAVPNQCDNSEEKTSADEGEDSKTLPLVKNRSSEEVDAICKSNSTQKINEDDQQDKEECVVKCLYYAIQCCECTIQ